MGCFYCWLGSEQSGVNTSARKLNIFFLISDFDTYKLKLFVKISCRKKLVTFILSSNSKASTKTIMELNDKFLRTISAIAASTSTVFALTKCKQCVRPFHRHNVGMFLVHKYLNFHKACSTVSLHTAIRNFFERLKGCCFGLYKNYADENADIWRYIHSLVFSLRGRAGRNQSPVMWPVWLWHTASWASSWG